MIVLRSKIKIDQVEIDIKRLIEALPIDQQEVLVMRMYQDMSFKEISEITGKYYTSLGRMRIF
jgi:RNA polymerase sigma-70 factor (ECF subfamily)